MYFDFFQLPTILGPASPCPFSCIYFRPTFHYHQFNNYQPSWSEKFRAFRKKIVLGRVLKNAKVQTLFCLDPFAAEYIREHFSTKAQIIHLPDPVKIYDDEADVADEKTAQLRSELEVDDRRVVFLLLGVLDRRKGVVQLLQAIETLDPDIARQVCLLLTGPVEAIQRDQVNAMVAKLNETTEAQVILKDQFVQDRQIQDYYRMADVVTAPYQKHMGMSAALIRAAAVGKPVLASNYGLAGELTQHKKLGLTVDACDPQQIADGMQAMIADPHGCCDYDVQAARQFASENSPENTSRTIFHQLCKAIPSG